MSQEHDVHMNQYNGYCGNKTESSHKDEACCAKPCERVCTLAFRGVWVRLDQKELCISIAIYI